MHANIVVMPDELCGMYENVVYVLIIAMFALYTL